jgi:hypothetical protein
MRRLILKIALLISITLIINQQVMAAEKKMIPLYTPPTGGTAYILGAGIASVTNKYMSDVEMVVETTTGTLEMVRRLMERERMKREAFATFGTVEGNDAFKGLREYSGKPFSNLRAISFQTSYVVYLTVPANSSIQSYADIKGKRVGMGGAGSSVAVTGFILLEAHGVKREDFKPSFYTYKQTMEGIMDGSLDAGFLGGSYPMASYTELSLTHSVRIVPVDRSAAEKVMSERPYILDVVKAKSYRGLEQDTPVMGWAGGIFTHAGVSNELIYQFIKNLYEHREEYYQVHVAAKELKPEVALKGISIPLHPGAEKYLKEIGVIKR